MQVHGWRSSSSQQKNLLNDQKVYIETCMKVVAIIKLIKLQCNMAK